MFLSRRQTLDPPPTSGSWTGTTVGVKPEGRKSRHSLFTNQQFEGSDTIDIII